MSPLTTIALVVLFVFLALCGLVAAALWYGESPGRVVGGAARAKASKASKANSNTAAKAKASSKVIARPRRRPKNAHSIVVDTLNLLHWGRKPDRRTNRVTTCEIAAVIDKAAPILRQTYPGRVYFVVKTRDGSNPADIARAEAVRGIYAGIASRNKVFVSLVERLSDPPGAAKNAHPQVGRDDFYIAVLAAKHGCSALSRDRFRDLNAMKSDGLEAFHVWTFSPFGAAPARDFVRPSVGFSRLARPTRVDFDAVPNLPEAFGCPGEPSS